jgi:hypothetical protein
MKDTRGLDHSQPPPARLTTAARLLRLDQGVEAILEAAKRWPATPIVQLYAAAFWLYGQTEDARANAAKHLRACATLAVNPRERALHRALTLWHANDNLRALESLEAITVEWPRDLFSAKLAEFLYYVLGQQFMGARFRAQMNRSGPCTRTIDFLAMAAFASGCATTSPKPRPVPGALAIEPRSVGGMPTPRPDTARPGQEGLSYGAFLPLLPRAGGRSIRTTRGTSRCFTSRARCRRRDGRLSFAHLGHHPSFVVEQLDAIALLWRIGWRHGMDARGRRSPITCGRDRDVHPFMNALPLCAGAAFGGRSRPRRPTARSVMPLMTSIGGSDAQDDLFRQTYLRSLQAAGRYADAAAYAARMTGAKTRTPLDRVLAG